VEGYDMSFLVVHAQLEVLYKQKLVDVGRINLAAKSKKQTKQAQVRRLYYPVVLLALHIPQASPEGKVHRGGTADNVIAVCGMCPN
jgi:hypothetical protein